jgi:DNA transposition AAA+ family ATPase
MDDQAFQGSQGGWDGPALDQPLGTDCAPEVVSEWQDLRGTLRMLAEAERWTMAEVSRRSEVPPGTFSPWFAGKYRGLYKPVHLKIARWLRAHEEARDALGRQLQAPGFLETRAAREVLNALMVAQRLPGMVLITLGSGMGKTTCTDHVLETRPNTYRITLSPSTRSIPALYREIAFAVGLDRCHPKDMRDRIGEKLRRVGDGKLLMVDEAQNLSDDAVNELRYFLDVFKCGIALLGNEDVTTRWGKAKIVEGYGQLHRRFAARVRRLKPYPEDVQAYVAAWGFQDPEIVRMLNAIGMRAGALGQIEGTVKLAAIMATGRDLTAADIRAAWSNRADEVQA